MMQIKQLLMTNEQYMECAMIWKQSVILGHNWVKTFLKLHLHDYDKFPTYSYLYLTWSM